MIQALSVIAHDCVLDSFHLFSVLPVSDHIDRIDHSEDGVRSDGLPAGQCIASWGELVNGVWEGISNTS